MLTFYSIQTLASYYVPVTGYRLILCVWKEKGSVKLNNLLPVGLLMRKSFNDLSIA